MSFWPGVQRLQIRLTVVSILLLMPGKTPHCQAAGQSSSEELTRAIQGLADWQASFPSLRIVSHDFSREEVRSQYPTFPPDATLDGKAWGSRNTLWFENRYRVYYSHEELNGESVDSREVMAVNGFGYWSGISAADAPDQFVQINVFPVKTQASPQLPELQDHPLQGKCRLMALKGLWQDNHCSWLGERLRNSKNVQYLGVEEIDGSPCRMIEANERFATQNAIGTYREVWWLDPALQYLPRKHERTFPYYDSKGNRKLLTSTWQSKEFLQVNRLDSAGATVWLPRSGTYHHEETFGRSRSLRKLDYEWTITEAVILAAIPDGLLKSPEPTRRTEYYRNQIEPNSPDEHSRRPQRAGMLSASLPATGGGATGGASISIGVDDEPSQSLPRTAAKPPTPTLVQLPPLPIIGAIIAILLCTALLWRRSHANLTTR